MPVPTGSVSDGGAGGGGVDSTYYFITDFVIHLPS